MLMKFSFFRTPFKHVPSVEGKEIDLYLLYWLVTAQGGFEKVSTFKVKSAFCPTNIRSLFSVKNPRVLRQSGLCNYDLTHRGGSV